VAADGDTPPERKGALFVSKKNNADNVFPLFADVLPNNDVVALLEILLEQARSGHCTGIVFGVTFVEDESDGRRGFVVNAAGLPYDEPDIAVKVILPALRRKMLAKAGIKAV